jgi:hypothetical protein
MDYINNPRKYFSYEELIKYFGKIIIPSNENINFSYLENPSLYSNYLNKYIKKTINFCRVGIFQILELLVIDYSNPKEIKFIYENNSFFKTQIKIMNLLKIAYDNNYSREKFIKEFFSLIEKENNKIYNIEISISELLEKSYLNGWNDFPQIKLIISMMMIKTDKISNAFETAFNKKINIDPLTFSSENKLNKLLNKLIKIKNLSKNTKLTKYHKINSEEEEEEFSEDEEEDLTLNDYKKAVEDTLNFLSIK